MKSYQEYTEEEFIGDSSFRRWVLEQHPGDDSFWVQWIRENPDRAGTAGRARGFLLALQARQATLAESEVEDRAGQIVALARERKERIIEPNPAEKTAHWLYRTGRWAAAFALLVVGLGWWYLQRPPHVPATYARLVASSRIALQERVNSTRQPLRITLSDGSSISLAPNSKVSYPETFAGQRREVYLTGEAFFEVTKNPGKPFLVYSHKLVTQVLGTSFRIRAYEGDKQVRVTVRTGRVLVYPNENPTVPPGKVPASGIVLTPNQQVVFDGRQSTLQKGLADAPQLLPAAKAQTFVFEDAPVTEVLASLSAAYGVEIVFDQAAPSGCLITTNLTEESLYKKLGIICDAIGGSYETAGERIIVHHTGCR